MMGGVQIGKTHVIVAMVIVLIVFVIASLAATQQKNALYSDMLQGMWTGGGDFLEKAELSGMYFYIGEPYKTSWNEERRKAYLIIHQDNALVYNSTVDLIIKRNVGTYINPTLSDEIERKIILTDKDPDTDPDTEEKLLPDADTDSASINDIMPKQMTMFFDPRLPRLIFRGENDEGDDRIYAHFFKDAESSVGSSSIANSGLEIDL